MRISSLSESGMYGMAWHHDTSGPFHVEYQHGGLQTDERVWCALALVPSVLSWAPGITRREVADSGIDLSFSVFDNRTKVGLHFAAVYVFKMMVWCVMKWLCAISLVFEYVYKPSSLLLCFQLVGGRFGRGVRAGLADDDSSLFVAGLKMVARWATVWRVELWLSSSATSPPRPSRLPGTRLRKHCK